MSSSTTKKVVVDRFDRSPLRGFVNPSAFLQPEGVELLSPSGGITLVPYSSVKAVSFVRDMDGEGIFGERREFLSRPKSAGLWVECNFSDGDKLQGIVPNDLLLLETQGVNITPPEIAGNTQRVFVPRQALASVSVLGVVGSPLKRKKSASETRQITLFGEP